MVGASGSGRAAHIRIPRPPDGLVASAPTVCLAGCLLLFAVMACPVRAEAEDPGPRWGHVFEFDPVRGEALLFGGARERRSYLGDTWTWTDGRWRQHRVPGPPPRGFAAAAFHESRGTIVIHGGRGPENETLSDTWEWDGQRWRQIQSETSFAADHHEMAYIPGQDSLVVFGGWDGTDVLDTTWLFRDAWKRHGGPGPRKRSAFGMAFDRDRGRVVLTGGLWINGQYADVWEWAGEGWQAVSGPYDNSSVDHHRMVYDQERRQMLLFGGKDYRYQPLGRLAAVHEGRIAALPTDAGPSPRHSVGLLWDAQRKRVLLYGGKYYENGGQLPLGDLWSWDGSRWQQLGREEPPAER